MADRMVALGHDTRYRSALEALQADGICASFSALAMPGNRMPWTAADVPLVRDQNVTILADGQLTSRALGLTAGPRLHLWRRIRPGGEVAKATRDTTSFVAERSGELELGVLHGEWKSRDGEVATPAELYELVDGTLGAVVIAWAMGVDAVAGTSALRERLGPDPLVDAELARLADTARRPEPWGYLWELGDSETFRAGGTAGRPSIECRTSSDAAILRREVSVATTPDTRLAWRWRIDDLPSSVREDELLQHDYLSIAVEWDCGRDITYMWSCELEQGTVFTCPIPWWAPRETHVVVRSGGDGLGAWHAEERDLYTDYREILQAEPGSIVAVWLIAVSLFQGGEGRAEFEDIELRGTGGPTRVL